MKLLEKTQRDLIGIDSFERAIVFAVLMIREGLKIADLPSDKVILYQAFKNQNNVKTLNLTIELKIPYDQMIFNAFGGDFIQSIISFDDDTIEPSYDGVAIPPTLNNQRIIESEPIEVNTLEKYLVWAVSRWIYWNKKTFLTNWDSEGYLSFLGEARPANITAKLTLPLDYETYLETNNLIASVAQRLPEIIENNNQTNSSLIGNDVLIGNDYLFRN